MKKSRFTSFVLIVALCAVGALLGVYYLTAQKVKKDAEHNFTIRSNIARTYISLMQQHVDAMRRTFEKHYHDPIDATLRNSKKYPEYNVWALSGYSNDGGTDKINGTFTGTGDFPLSDPVKREVSAALNLDPMMAAILSTNKNVSWIYYTSEQHFIYLAPKLAVKEYQFADHEYERPFYFQADPQHNPDKRQIISDLYVDSAGKGLMITISSPVYIDTQFRGVVSLDLDIDLLRRLTSIENIPGESILIDENGKIVARKGDFSLDENYKKDHIDKTWHSGSDGFFWMESDIIGGELVLLQRIPKSEFFIYTAGHSALIWTLIILLCLIIIYGTRYITIQKEINAAVQESEEKYKALLEALPDTMFTLNAEGDFIDYYVPKNRTLFFPPKSFLGKNIRQVFAANNIENIVDALKAVFADGKPHTITYSINVNGIEHILESRIVLKNQHEALLIERDLTEQKKLEELLSFERKQLLSLFDSIEAIIYVTDIATNEILYVNNFFEKILGHPVIGKICYREFQNLSEPCSFCTNSIIIAQKPNPYYWEFFNPLLGKTFSIVDKIITWPDGRDVRFEMAVDITQQKKAQHSLEESEQRLELILKNSSDIIVMLNAEGRQIYVSPSAEAITGFSPDELLGKSIAELIHPDDLPGVLAVWQDALLHSKKTERLQYRHIHKTRQWVHCEAIGQNLLNIPPIEAVLINVRDITYRIEAEQEKNKLQDQLIQAQKMESIGRLAGGVAHDFNNMLSVIIGHAELALATMNPNDRIYTGMKEIENAAKRSAELTKQLLAFARKQTVSPVVLEINNAIDRIITMLQRLIGEDISLVWRKGNDLPRIKIDPSQIDQILANLCVNARDAIKGTGHITIETKAVVLHQDDCTDRNNANPGQYVAISVSDTGCGMDEETMQHIFEPFYTTKDLGKGTGLGLATIYGIIRQNSGFIDVYSERGLGTTIKVYLPAINDNEQRDARNNEFIPTGSETILLLEDEQQLLDLTTTMLTSLGYSVKSFKNPKDAIAFFTGNIHDIDIILTDVIMPDMNGKEFVEKLHTISPAVKVCYMSGYTADVIGHHGILDDMTHFIQKPFSVRQLADKIRDILDTQSQ